MTPQVFHDSFRFYATGLQLMIAAVAVVVFGSLLWGESSSSARPQGARKRDKLPDSTRP
jgi:hypothetical protein